MSQPLPLDEAIQALKRDPTHPVRVRVDEKLTVEVRAVEHGALPKRSAADAFRELGRWEGETGADFGALPEVRGAHPSAQRRHGLTLVFAEGARHSARPLVRWSPRCSVGGVSG